MPRDHRHRLTELDPANPQQQRIAGARAEQAHGDTVPPLLALADSACSDPGVSGAKAAWLARGLQTGLPVLPGWVVTAPQSGPHMAIGADALARRGSGGARLEVSQAPLHRELASSLVDTVAGLGDPLVVRSSSILEGGSEWAGAFTSYLEVHPEEVPRAVTGCWASAFGVSTIDRHLAARITPGSAPMAVLVQPALDPDFGGTARIEENDVLIVAVAGSPAPLVQGWEPGAQARLSREGRPSGGSAVELMGEDLLESVAATMWEANGALGATVCEWAVVSDRVYLLQMMRPAPSTATATVVTTPELAGDTARRLARLVRRFPGPLGESLVLPWAVGDPTLLPDEAIPADMSPRHASALASQHAATLAAEVWSLPKPGALATAADVLREVRGSKPGPALDRLAALRPPDRERGALVLSLLATVRHHLVDLGVFTWPELGWHIPPAEVQRILARPGPTRQRDRIGFDRWEPFTASVTIASGRRAIGSPAAPGIATGRLCHIPDVRAGHFRPRDVIVAPHPTPNLAALLWDASALVTTGGGPGAHLFESARALAIPAVCGIHLEEALGTELSKLAGARALAVDGGSGSVHATEW